MKKREKDMMEDEITFEESMAAYKKKLKDDEDKLRKRLLDDLNARAAGIVYRYIKWHYRGEDDMELVKKALGLAIKTGTIDISRERKCGQKTQDEILRWCGIEPDPVKINMDGYMPRKYWKYHPITGKPI